MGRGDPPQGRLRDHDHSRPGEGGVTLTDAEITAAILSLAAAGNTDIPVTDFAVGNLSDGQFLQRSGDSLVGGSAGGIASGSDTLSDITRHAANFSGSGTVTVVNITATSGTLIGAMLLAGRNENHQFEVTIDGATTQNFNSETWETQNLGNRVINYLPAANFDTSLKVDVDSAGGGNDIGAAIAYTKS